MVSTALQALAIVLTASALVGATFVVSQNPNQNPDKVEICHFPPGNPENARTLSVNSSSVDDHIAHHGDHRGACGGTVYSPELTEFSCQAGPAPATQTCYYDVTVPAGYNPYDLHLVFYSTGGTLIGASTSMSGWSARVNGYQAIFNTTTNPLPPASTTSGGTFCVTMPAATPGVNYWFFTDASGARIFP